MPIAEITVDSFLAYTIGILVYFVGMNLNARVAVLRNFNIPEPVTGGILAALMVLAIYLLFHTSLTYNLEVRDRMLVYFFTCVGLNARFSDLMSGGKPLAILLALTLSYIVFQDALGVAIARLLGLPDAMGILVGSASLIGGHGTAIAWAPEIATHYGVPNALEIGMAAATLGLVIASLLGGPIARLLLAKDLPQLDVPDNPVVGLTHEEETTAKINHVNIMGSLLAIHFAMILGYGLDKAFAEFGLKLPLFVSCLLVAILMSNSIPYVFPTLRWPARTKALAIISDFSLGLFIAMSLMSMQLWTVAELAGPLLILLLVQTLATAAFILLLFYRLMGRDYQSVVLSAGFAGFALGATPTAIANMTAVTKTHGPAPTAFIILPLVGAFFVDITNAVVIQFFLSLSS